MTRVIEETIVTVTEIRVSKKHVKRELVVIAQGIRRVAFSSMMYRTGHMFALLTDSVVTPARVRTTRRLGQLFGTTVSVSRTIAIEETRPCLISYDCSPDPEPSNMSAASLMSFFAARRALEEALSWLRSLQNVQNYIDDAEEVLKCRVALICNQSTMSEDESSILFRRMVDARLPMVTLTELRLKPSVRRVSSTLWGLSQPRSC